MKNWIKRNQNEIRNINQIHKETEESDFTPDPFQLNDTKNTLENHKYLNRFDCLLKIDQRVNHRATIPWYRSDSFFHESFAFRSEYLDVSPDR
ncbi:hypothetical protein EHQ12_17680 [Leptospira gomenensis]|uniref:Uncharacterized protein n=1 Tax=Leptospira gomenensis TaxID=2484974 RepID=A0A5F1YE71_9LEPT|nr:hypothetical protein [Leptospira gomenensis]TGK33174.1 hypothetical protein EHQ12_17680 [Leptospira gomenensis]TGK35592.1 hypothetical protein EHQ17_06645 [Leptospira gomenensis]TGK40916.1 hypothetical protein EHQ07_17605 [Leptospira gomenensis]TGK61206.1 hypothetical protein EHQ13_10140 [Leptospira gomenensis]